MLRGSWHPSDRAERSRQAQEVRRHRRRPAVPCMADRERVARGIQQRGCTGFYDGVRGSREEDEGGALPRAFAGAHGRYRRRAYQERSSDSLTYKIIGFRLPVCMWSSACMPAIAELLCPTWTEGRHASRTPAARVAHRHSCSIKACTHNLPRSVTAGRAPHLRIHTPPSDAASATRLGAVGQKHPTVPGFEQGRACPPSEI